MNVDITLTVRTEPCSLIERFRNMPRVWRVQYRSLRKSYGLALALYGVWALAGKRFVVEMPAKDKAA